MHPPPCRASQKRYSPFVLKLADFTIHCQSPLPICCSNALRRFPLRVRCLGVLGEHPRAAAESAFVAALPMNLGARMLRWFPPQLVQGSLGATEKREHSW